MDLNAFATAGRQAAPEEKMPGRGRRRTHNPFDELIQKLAQNGLTWTYEKIATDIANGDTLSAAKQLENALRAAGTRLDVRSKETGGAGYKTTVRTDSDGENTSKIWVNVVSRSDGDATDETAVPATNGRRGRR